MSTLGLVSVNIPTRNSEKTLRECLEAVKKQTYTNIEIIVIDSMSTDTTQKIAREYGAFVINTDWKLLGARFLGVQASKGEYVLLLDSDQLLYPNTIKRLVNMMGSYDMMCLEESSFAPKTTIEKLMAADRELINQNADQHLDPMEGVMLARFYKKAVLQAAFDKMPIEEIKDVVAHDHAIIYLEAFKISQKVGVLKDAVMHKEPSTFGELWAKNYRYGKTTRDLIDKNLYTELLNRKTRFRKGSSVNKKSIQSMILLLLKGVPYYIGLHSKR